MINGYSSYIDYFRQLSVEHVAINDFVQGGSDRVLQRQNANLKYPLLWMDFPVVVPLDEGERMRYDSALWVLTNAHSGDWDKENEAMESMETVALDILARMVNDAEQSNLFGFDISTASLSPKPKVSGDNDFGWVIEFDVVVYRNSCYDPAKWAINPPQ